MVPTAIAALADGLRARVGALRAVPPEGVASALANLHALWSAPDSPLRRGAVAPLHEVTGYAPQAIDISLRRLFAGLGERSLRSWLRAAGGGLPRGTRTFGPELTVIVSSGNIPGASLPSVVQAVLLRSPCLAKTAAAEPVLLPLYARSLAEVAPEIAAGLVVTHWEGGRADLEGAILSRAEALVAYGDDETLRSLRRHTPPSARFLGYGHRISFSAIGRERLTARTVGGTAGKAAWDVAHFDQQGCLSPQALYVERGGEISPEAFAERLAGQLDRLEQELPRRTISPAEAAAIHQYRAGIEMRGLSDARVRLWTSAEGTAWTVALVPDPDLAPCPLNRTAVLRPLDSLEELPALLHAQGPRLISAALGVETARFDGLGSSLAAAGVTRVTRLGRAQEPGDALLHDGVHAMAAMARFAVTER